MKKRIVFAMMMMVSALSLSAQFYVKPEVGMASVTRIPLVPLDRAKWNSSWKAGLGLEYQLSKRFGIQSGAYFTMRREEYGPFNPNFTHEDVQLNTLTSRRHYLQIPLMAKLYCPVGDETRLTFAAGVYAGYGLSSKLEMKYYYLPYNSYGYGYSSSSEDNWPAGLYRWDWGTSLAVGLEVKQWMFNAAWDFALGKEHEDDEIGGNYHTLSLTVGYSFRLTK